MAEKHVIQRSEPDTECPVVMDDISHYMKAISRLREEVRQLQEKLILNEKVRKDAERRLTIEFTRAEQLNKKLTEVQLAKTQLQGEHERLVTASEKLSEQTNEIHGASAVLLESHVELIKAARGLLNGLPKKAREVWLKQYPILGEPQ